MATFPLTKANCDVPGSGGYDLHFYGGHPYEHLRIWRPNGASTTGFKNKGCIVRFHGGLGLNQGNQGLNLTSSATWMTPMHETHGWPVVSIEHPPVEENKDHKRTPCSARLWPAHVFSCARALQYIASKFDDPALWGTDGNGLANTIDPTKIVIFGSSYGGTISMLLSVIPTAILKRTGELFLGRSAFDYSRRHLPRVAIYDTAQVDWTQFTMDPTVTTGTYKDNRLQLISWYEEGINWGNTYLSPGQVTVPPSKIPLHWKKWMSPWWWMVAGFHEARGIHHIGMWAKAVHGDPAQANLTWQDWSPGTQRIAEDLGKSWKDPHHYFQGKPWGDALTQLGITNFMIWGNATNNPAPGLNHDDVDDNDFIENYLTVVLGL